MESRKLLSPLSSLGLDHRVVMAPLTRLRGDKETLAPREDIVTYYAQRASKGGLLITEASPISPETPYETAPGIFTPDQEAGWKKVCEAVHQKGGKISMQLWHLGRNSHSIWGQTHPLLSSLGRPLGSVSSSEVKGMGMARDWEGNKVEYGVPRALTTEEVEERIPNDFKLAAEAAKRCGFDFVEIHGAHGYLIDQFLSDGVNKRNDQFGTQTLENRTRLLGLVLKKVIEVMGRERVGIRISPIYKDTFAYYGCRDSDSEKTYKDIIGWLDQFGLGYLLLSEPRWNGGRKNLDPATDPTFSLPLRNSWARSVYKGVIIGSSSFTPETAEKAIQEGIYDAIAFGRFFISNPDFVDRIKSNAKLNVYNTKTFYSRGNEGFIDYPTMEENKKKREVGGEGFKEIEVKDIGKQKRAKL